MNRNLVILTVTFLLISTFGLGQTKYKEIDWKQIGVKFKVPSFVKVNSSGDEGMELESEDFLIYVDLVDEFDSLDELISYYKVKKVIEIEEDIDEKTFSGEAASGFIKLTSEGDAIDMYNVFGNLQSKFNDNEKVAFDISIYEFNDKIEAQLNEIMSSIEFYEIGAEASRGKGKMFTSKSVEVDDEDDDSYQQSYAANNNQQAAAPVKKKSFLSKMLDFASPIIANVVPFGGVATSILKAVVD